MSIIASLLFTIFITFQPPIILDNGSNEPSCWEGNCVIGVLDGEVYQVCQAYCNPAGAPKND